MSEADAIGAMLGILSDIGVLGIIRAGVVLFLAISALFYFTKSSK